MRCSMVGLMIAALGSGAAENVPAAAGGETSAVAAVSRGSHAENRWRYVWHNDRWWYLAAGQRWSYFDGRRWNTYEPRQPSFATLGSRYRKAPAFERPPAAPPRLPVSELADVSGQGMRSGEQADLPEPLSFSKSMNRPPSLVPPDDLRAPRTRRDGANTQSGRLDAKRDAAKGGGAFGGPTGGSFGAGSAVGGASTPQ